MKTFFLFLTLFSLDARTSCHLDAEVTQINMLNGARVEMSGDLRLLIENIPSGDLNNFTIFQSYSDKRSRIEYDISKNLNTYSLNFFIVEDNQITFELKEKLMFKNKSFFLRSPIEIGFVDNSQIIDNLKASLLLRINKNKERIRLSQPPIRDENLILTPRETNAIKHEIQDLQIALSKQERYREVKQTLLKSLTLNCN